MRPFSKARLAAAVAAAGLSLSASAGEAAWRVPDPRDMVRGSPTAPVTIVEYASVGCPHCAHLHNEVFGAFKAKYIDTGKVRWVAREMITGDPSLAAGGFLLARCAGPSRYFDVTDAIYRDQDKIEADLHAGMVSIAKSVGMTEAQMTACLQDKKGLAELQDRLKMAEADGIDSTPTLMVDGKEVGGGDTDMAKFDKIVADALKTHGKKPAAKPGAKRPVAKSAGKK